MIDTPAIEKLLGELEAATGLLPITCHNTPDYAEATGTDFMAMTMRPEAFMALNHLPSLITTIRALMEAVENKVSDGYLNVWRPIETAPKDGTGIIVIDMSAEKPEPGYANWIFDCWSAVDGEFEGAEGDEALFHAMVWVSPTHWTPLPQPPAIRSKGDA